MRFFLTAGLLLGWLTALPLIAAENVAEFNTRLWQSDEGMPVDAARSIAQTPDGYLWVATQSGLARFDGRRFEVFDRSKVPSLPSVNFVAVRVTRDGSLWAATYDAGLIRFRDGVFTHFGKREGLASDRCLGSLFEAGDGSLWIGTYTGLSRYHDGQFTTVNTNLTRDICEDLHSNLWFATASGIDCWSNGAFILHLGKADGLQDPNIRAICCGRYGTIWASCGADVRVIDHNQVRSFISRSGPFENIVTALHQDRHGTLWMGTYNGLNRIVSERVIPEYNADGSLYGAVSEIFEDREDTLWVCAKDGLLRLKPNRILCFTRRQGLGNDNVSSVMEDSSDAIRVGSWDGGLNRLKNGNMTHVTSSSPFSPLVLAQCEDHEGNFWFGTDFDGGLYEFEGDTLKHYTDPASNAIPAVRVIIEDRDNQMWFGTGHGLYWKRENRIEKYGPDETVARDVIRDLLQDSRGDLWMATQAGLVRKHGETMTRFTTTNGLPHNFVTALFEDKEQTLWVGTSGGGLVRVRDSGKSFMAYTAADGLCSDYITCILEDDNGWFWFGSNHGIFRVERRDLEEFKRGSGSLLRCIEYGKADGMVNKICNAVAKPSACKSHDGRLWFATIKGLCVVNPREKILSEIPAPPVVIEEVLSDRESRFDPQYTEEPIVFHPSHGELEFRYAALSYRAPEGNHFKYKLDGVDANWIDAGSRLSAHYDNIYPGHYQFQVLAANSDQIWNMTGATVSLMILPHFWQAWWFRPTVIIILAASLAVLYRIIVLRRREIGQLRMRIAADLHDEIGSNLASIALLSQMGQKCTEKTANSELVEINRIALTTVNSIREIVWFINPEHDTMPEMVARMQDIAAQMLAGLHYGFRVPASLSSGKLSPEFRRNLFLIFKEILHNLVKHAQASHVEIDLHESHGVLLLRVTDDGRGFDPAAVTRGNGLKNIRLRAGQLGGTVEVARRAAGGMTVTVCVQIT